MSIRVQRQRSRSQRSGNDGVHVGSLASDLAVFARDKECAFDFEFKRYGKHRRSQGPDREGLLFYKDILSVLLRHAPNGRPSLVALRECWLYLQRQYSVRAADDPPTTQLNMFDWANQCSDRARVALKHISDLKESGSSWLPPDLADLVAMVNSECDSQLVRQLTQKDSDSSVIVRSVACRCPDCYQPTRIALQDEEAASSQTSVDAQQLTHSVPCGSGAVGKALKLLKRPAAGEPTNIDVVARPAADAPTYIDVKIVQRRKPFKEAYILKDGSYLVGCSEKKHKRFHEAIDYVAAKLRAGDDMSKQEARHALGAWLADRAAAM